MALNSEGLTTWSKNVFSKWYTFPYYRASQSTESRVATRWSPFTTRVKRIVSSVYLNFVCYLISYTKIIYEMKSLGNFNLLYIYYNKSFQIYGIIKYLNYLQTIFQKGTKDRCVRMTCWCFNSGVIRLSTMYLCMYAWITNCDIHMLLPLEETQFCVCNCRNMADIKQYTDTGIQLIFLCNDKC